MTKKERNPGIVQDRQRKRSQSSMQFLATILLVLGLFSATGCTNGTTGSPPTPNSSQPASNSIQPTPNNRLSTENVQKAVDQMIRPYKTGGRIIVLGVKESPNAVGADLQFTDFTADFHNDTELGAERNSYSGLGTAEITRYTDGRIVLTKIRWGFGLYVYGQISL